MKIVEINAVPYGSTGKITKGIADVARKKGHEVYLYFSWTKALSKSNDRNVMVGSFVGKALHMVLSKITGYHGRYSVADTKKLIKELKRIKPDIIHLHIVHSWSINLELLFDYIKQNGIKVFWTFHDCWAFTGQCPHFIMAKCDKWKTGCFDCPQCREYPATYVDRSKKMWEMKRTWFTGVEDLTVITPSVWLAGLTKDSFMQAYPVKVINNGIDLNIFKPTPSDFRKKHSCEDKVILLGVAFGWGKRKGLDVFIDLANDLEEKYQIVLVGTDDETDKQLPKNVISIHRTHDQQELAEIYTAADIFVNPTREDTYPTVNMESLACGTPVITFKTGGSPEIVNESCGIVVDCNDIDALKKAILHFSEAPVSREACLRAAERFDMHDRFAEYVDMIENG